MEIFPAESAGQNRQLLRAPRRRTRRGEAQGVSRSLNFHKPSAPTVPAAKATYPNQRHLGSARTISAPELRLSESSHRSNPVAGRSSRPNRSRGGVPSRVTEAPTTDAIPAPIHTTAHSTATVPRIFTPALLPEIPPCVQPVARPDLTLNQLSSFPTFRLFDFSGFLEITLQALAWGTANANK